MAAIDAGFETGRLAVRRLESDDGALFCRLYGDAAVMQHIGAPLDAAAAGRSFAKALALNAEPVPRRRFAVIRLRESEADAGILGLTWEQAAIEIGVMLLPAFQNSGIAAELILATVDRLFTAEDASLLCTRHDRDNPLALGLMRKLGFTLLPADEEESVCRWQLRREHWQAGPSAGLPDVAGACR